MTRVVKTRMYATKMHLLLTKSIRLCIFYQQSMQYPKLGVVNIYKGSCHMKLPMLSLYWLSCVGLVGWKVRKDVVEGKLL